MKLINGNNPQTMIPIISERLANDLKTITRNNNEITESRRDSPTHWHVNAEISQPTTIGFSEPYDQSWKAFVYKAGNKIDVIKAVPLYGTINGFYVKDTGNLEIDIEYVPQKWYEHWTYNLIFNYCYIYFIILIGSKSREKVKWVLHRIKFLKFSESLVATNIYCYQLNTYTANYRLIFLLSCKTLLNKSIAIPVIPVTSNQKLINATRLVGSSDPRTVRIAPVIRTLIAKNINIRISNL